MTVRIAQDVLDSFRRYTEEENTTMTSLVEAYFRHIPHQDFPEDTPIVRWLSGTISQQVRIKDHKIAPG